jgi:hypothetical protein
VLGNTPSGSLASDDAGNTTPVSPAGLSVSAIATLVVANIAPAAAEVARNALLSMFPPYAPVFIGLEKSIHEHLCGEDERAALGKEVCGDVPGITLRCASIPRSEAR